MIHHIVIFLFNTIYKFNKVPPFSVWIPKLNKYLKIHQLYGIHLYLHHFTVHACTVLGKNITQNHSLRVVYILIGSCDVLEKTKNTRTAYALTTYKWLKYIILDLKGSYSILCFIITPVLCTTSVRIHLYTWSFFAVNRNRKNYWSTLDNI